MFKFIDDTTPKKQARKSKQTEAQTKAAEELKTARAGDDARRLETRRKVVVGGALIALAKNDPEAAKMLARVKATMTRDSDIKLFKD